MENYKKNLRNSSENQKTLGAFNNIENLRTIKKNVKNPRKILGE